MKKVLASVIVIILSVLLVSFNQEKENPYVGTWEVERVKSFDKKYQEIADEFTSFKSTIVFNSDMTFSKTNINDTVFGKYKFTSNKFTFLEKNSKNKYQKTWKIRVPKGKRIKINYPELFTINKKDVFEFDVYYKKRNGK